MNIDYLADAGDLITLVAAQSVAATANGTGVDISNHIGNAVVILDSGAASAGTLPTLNVKLQSSADNSTNWTDVPNGAFPQITTVATLAKLVIRPRDLNKYLRAVSTIGGTASPAFPVAVHMLALKQN